MHIRLKPLWFILVLFTVILPPMSPMSPVLFDPFSGGGPIEFRPFWDMYMPGSESFPELSEDPDLDLPGFSPGAFQELMDTMAVPQINWAALAHLWAMIAVIAVMTSWMINQLKAGDEMHPPTAPEPTAD